MKPANVVACIVIILFFTACTTVSSLNPTSAATPTVYPPPSIKDVAVIWTEQGKNFCNTAIIGSQAVAFGACGGAVLTNKLDLDATARRQELAEFVKTFASFQAETPAGAVTFTGKGATVAAQSEQRMIAEWANLVYIEANAGRSGAAWGQVLGLNRKNGACENNVLSVSCDYLMVRVTGYATLYRTVKFTEIGSKRLTAGQLTRLYGLMDRLRRFYLLQPDATTTSTLEIDFRGTGSTDATSADIQEMFDLAGELFAGFN